MKSRWLGLTLGALCSNVACASYDDCNVASFESILKSLNSTATTVYARRISVSGASFDPSPECAVKLNVKPSDTTSYNVGLLLPEKDLWNNWLIATGDGGFGGRINHPEMGEYTLDGFATVATDTGHFSDIEDSSWALDNPESIIDWNSRALHDSVNLAKQIVSAYYIDNNTITTSIKHAYYTGCAIGGRQGPRSLQLYPNDFDGILIGDAAWQPQTASPGTRSCC